MARVDAMLRIKRLHDHVADARARLEKLSVHDELTGLHNYRYLHTRLAEEFKRAERSHEPLACAVVDIDRLHVLNQAAGRSVGDRLVSIVAGVVKACVREVDIVARFGGDEFLVMLPATHLAGSISVAERIWRGVGERGQTELGAPDANLTVSIGVALYPSPDVRTKDALLRAADSALHQAKREGGNRVCVFQQQGNWYTPAAGERVDGPDDEASLARLRGRT